jgi:hypothetical protein
MSDIVDDSEKIARFIFSSDHFSTISKRVKYGAFLPAKDNKASVFRINGYTEHEISQLDKQFVSGKRTDGKTSKARADFFVLEVRKSQLDVISEPTPHKDHANIEGYTSDKSAQKLKAIELANYATLISQEF